MISGVVTDDRQAVIHLIVRGPAGQEQEIEAIIDTGFDGYLSLPPSLIVLLGLSWRVAAPSWQTAARAFLISMRVQPFGTGSSVASQCMRPKPFRSLGFLYLKVMSLLFKSNVVEMSRYERYRNQEVANHWVEKDAADRASHPKR